MPSNRSPIDEDLEAVEVQQLRQAVPTVAAAVSEVLVPADRMEMVLMTELTQPELTGMPDPEPIVVPRWLHLCEEGAVMFAFCGVVFTAASGLPGIEDRDAKELARSAATFGCLVREQIGARAWEAALEQGGRMWTALYEQARAKTAAEGPIE